MSDHPWELSGVELRPGDEYWADWRCPLCALTCSTVHAVGAQCLRPADRSEFSCGRRRSLAVRAVMES